MLKYKFKTKSFYAKPHKVTEIANVLGVHRNTVHNMISRGELKSAELADLLQWAYNKGHEDCKDKFQRCLQGYVGGFLSNLKPGPVVSEKRKPVSRKK